MNKEQFKRKNEKRRLIDTYIKTIHRRYEPEPDFNVLPRFRPDIEKERILWHKKHSKLVEKIISILSKIDDLYDNRPKMSRKDMEQKLALEKFQERLANLPEPRLDPHCTIKDTFK